MPSGGYKSHSLIFEQFSLQKSSTTTVSGVIGVNVNLHEIWLSKKYYSYYKGWQTNVDQTRWFPISSPLMRVMKAC